MLTPLHHDYPDIIELGVPFTDPIADGAVIQAANSKALANGVTISTVLSLVREARTKGVTAPILLMGYYNPILRYGEKCMVHDSKKAGVSGFVMTDLPPEEGGYFRGLCVSSGLV